MKFFTRFLIVVFVLVTILSSCANDIETIKKFIDTELEPDMMGEKVEVLYSDSARLLMKLTSPLFKQFTLASEQRREFPQGLHVWFYEKTGELKAELTANWAKQDMATDIWEARSNVVLINSEGQKLETEQLFFDRSKGEVYSEQYTKLTKDGSYEGAGESFWAKQDFSEYKFFNKSGMAKTVIYVKDDETETDEMK